MTGTKLKELWYGDRMWFLFFTVANLVVNIVTFNQGSRPVSVMCTMLAVVYIAFAAWRLKRTGGWKRKTK